MTRSTVTRTALVLAAALGLVVPVAGPTSASAPEGVPAAPRPAAVDAAPTLTTATVASGLAIPWDVAFLPDGKMLVTERAGRIREYASGSPGAALVRTVTVPSVRAEGEAGVLGIAVDVDLARYPYVYVCASRDYSGSGGWVNQLLRYRVSTSGVLGGPTVLRSGMHASTIHNGCAVEMDASGHLWVGIGDASVASRAQDRSVLNGKVLRMTRTGGVPSSNPVIGGRRDVVYSLGHRNPQGIAFRPGTSQVYEVEHGPSTDDEVNLLRAGGNYGWPCYTGDGHPNATSGCSGPGSYLAPLWASGSPTIAPSGGSFARGAQWQDFAGSFFMSTLKQSDVRRFPVGSGGTSLGSPQTLYDGTFGRIRASVPGPGGQLYLTTSNGSGDRVIRVSPARPTLDRVAGTDRYGTAAAASAAAHPSGATDVIVVSGDDYPDALAAGAVAGDRDWPLLLTRAGSLPDATRDELARLRPDRIWVVGGSTSVGGDVRDALVPYAGSGSVTRVAGGDRYATAAAVSSRWFPSGSSAVFIATGQGFADALSAGAAAAKAGGPLLLTRPDRLSNVTAAELDRLDASTAYVLGGTTSVGAGVASAVGGRVSGSTVRLAGPDRYGTAAVVARRFWTTSDVWVASGRDFPDGLSGGAAAGALGSPVLLVDTDRVPPAAGQEMLRLAPARTTVVGGSSSVDGSATGTLRRLVGTS